jgi:hypothetical protein
LISSPSKYLMKTIILPMYDETGGVLSKLINEAQKEHGAEATHRDANSFDFTFKTAAEAKAFHEKVKHMLPPPSPPAKVDDPNDVPETPAE